MKKTIAIVAGGYSSEWSVSLKSAAGITSFIDSQRYITYIVIVAKECWEVNLPDGRRVPIDKNDFSFTLDGKKIKFDFAYITIHGTPGENGLLQGYFEMINLPFSCCGVLSAALTFDKYMCNRFLSNFGIRVAHSILLRQGDTVSSERVVSEIGLPCFIKPSVGGSSFGVTKVKNIDAIQSAIAKAFEEGEEVMIEAYLSGTEVTCGMYATRSKAVVFPVTEVVTDNEFFDFDAKYNGQVDEITPARISEELTHEVQQLTKKIYQLINAKGIIRIDYIIHADGTVNMLEVNTTPGMTATSFIPQQVAAAGLNISDVMSDIIEDLSL